MTYNDYRLEEANIVTERIKDKAPGYNDWPDIPVISVRELDVAGNPEDALAHGLVKGGLTTHKQVEVKQLPPEILNLFPYGVGWVSVDFTLVSPAGQSDPPATRNLLAVFDNRRTYSPVKEWPALHVTLGCAHDYDDAGSNHRRGYHVGRCRKCGHRFVCDSGD